MDFQLFDNVVVVRNEFDKRWDYMIGKSGTIVKVYEEEVLIHFEGELEDLVFHVREIEFNK